MWRIKISYLHLSPAGQRSRSERTPLAYTPEYMIMRLALALLFLLLRPSVIAKKHPLSAESEVGGALAEFINAFDNLDWEAFRLAFDDNATVFYPRAIPDRASGRPEFERFFKVVFEQLRNGRTTGPYMDIQPRDMKIQMLRNVAIVTFHLDDRPGFLNRRTIVLNKSKIGWKIVHLHASEASIATRQY